MKTPTLEFLLFFRNTQRAKGLSPQQIQTATMEWSAWFERLRNQGRIKDGRPLEQSGSFISREIGGLVRTTPFIGSKETITGYSLLEAGHLTEALEIAKECPILDHGSTIEIRPVAPKE